MIGTNYQEPVSQERVNMRLTKAGLLRSWTLLANSVYVGFTKTSNGPRNNALRSGDLFNGSLGIP